MKKMSVILIMLITFSFPVFATNQTKEEIYANFDFSDIYDAMGSDVYENIGDVEDFNSNDVSVSGFLSFVLSAVLNCLKPFLKNLSIILVYILVISFIKKLCENFSGGDISNALNYPSLLALSAVIFSMISADFKIVQEFLLAVKSYYTCAIPIMTGMYALGGNNALAIANSASSTVILSVISFICQDLILPIARLIFALNLAANLSTNIKLAPFVKFLTGFASKVMALFMGLIASGMLLSCKLASANDGVGVRVLRFAASSFIPIVGGAVSEATRTLISCLSLIRSSFGIFGITALIYMLFPVLITIIMGQFSFNIAASFAQTLDCTKEGGLLSDCANVYSIALSAVISICVCFILACAIFINTAAVI